MRSNRDLARELGVSHETVASVRDELEATSQIAKLDRHVGRDGKSYPATAMRSWEQREAVADAVRDGVMRSNRSIAREVGVSDRTVASVRLKLEARGEVPKLARRIGDDGKWRAPTKRRSSS